MTSKLSISSKALSINRLLQLCSANLPVGGFSFSQGLEYAIEKHWINNAHTCENWIHVLLMEAIATTDLAMLPRLLSALDCEQAMLFEEANDFLIACRESKELREADLAMGKALIRLLKNLDAIEDEALAIYFEHKEISFVSAFAIVAYAWGISTHDAQAGYCWTIIDNQVAAATKLVPLGQTQAQNLLFNLSANIDDYIFKANATTDDDLGGSLPRLAMASAWHETQYSRLFRS